MIASYYISLSFFKKLKINIIVPTRLRNNIEMVIKLKIKIFYFYYYHIYLYIHFLLKIHWSILLKGIRIPGVDDISQIPVSIQKPEKGKSTQVRNIELGMFPSALLS